MTFVAQFPVKMAQLFQPWRVARPLRGHLLQCHRNTRTVTVCNKSFVSDDMTNVTPNILGKADQNLLAQPNHPLKIVKDSISDYFQGDEFRVRGRPIFTIVDDLHPVVSTKQNFDSLLVPEDHVTRAKSDNYYINKEQLLRAHTTAHQAELVRQGLDAFLCFGDVYRRDEIDRSHYPVFHQVDGVKLFTDVTVSAGDKAPRSDRRSDRQESHTAAAAHFVAQDLKYTLEGLVQHIFGRVKMRWVEAYFPFTHPSWELEIFFQGEWLEVLGCGVMEQDILDQAGATSMGWAFGIGLERIAMVRFGIPDIRLFWSKDERFLCQFNESIPLDEMKFEPFSKYPSVQRDITFWIPDDYSENNFTDLVRNVAGDLVETVRLVDEYRHPKAERTSHCYSITYRSMERTLTSDEVNRLQHELRESAHGHLGVELR
eukprot:m.51940 g.51940  ORF g.51940 m.51940 type:complete len:428 (-) comp13467_c0_seq2:182-1465(-)